MSTDILLIVTLFIATSLTVLCAAIILRPKSNQHDLDLLRAQLDQQRLTITDCVDKVDHLSKRWNMRLSRERANGDQVQYAETDTDRLHALESRIKASRGNRG